jgi:hypothetical protein
MLSNFLLSVTTDTTTTWQTRRNIDGTNIISQLSAYKNLIWSKREQSSITLEVTDITSGIANFETENVSLFCS